jgi:hypothetical protein
VWHKEIIALVTTADVCSTAGQGLAWKQSLGTMAEKADRREQRTFLCSACPTLFEVLFPWGASTLPD